MGQKKKNHFFWFKEKVDGKYLVINATEMKVGTHTDSPRVPSWRYGDDNRVDAIHINMPGDARGFVMRLTPGVMKTMERMAQVLMDPDPRCNNLLFRGAAGCGKNSLIITLAALVGAPIRIMSLHGSVETCDLLYRQEYGETEEQKTGYLLSDLLQGGILGEWVILDEVNKARNPGVLSSLNSILENRFAVLRDGRLVTFAEGFRVIALANPEESCYAVYWLATDFTSRFCVIEFDYPPPEEEVEILQEHAPNLDPDFIARLVLCAYKIRKNKNLQLPRDLSTRTLIRMVTHLKKVPGDIRTVPVQGNYLTACCEDVFHRYFSISHDETREAIVTVLKSKQVLTERPGENILPPVIETRQIGCERREYTCFYNENGDKLIELQRGTVPPGLPLPSRAVNTQAAIRQKLDLARSIYMGHPLNHIMLCGETGSGKTAIALDFLMNDLNLNIHFISLTRDSDFQDLIVQRAFDGKRTTFEETPLIAGMRNGEPVFIDNASKPRNTGVLAVLNNITQFGQITLPSGETVTARPGFFIVLSVNHSLGGEDFDQVLSGELVDRFNVIEFPVLNIDQQEELLRIQYLGVPEELIRKISRCVSNLRSDYLDGRFSIPPVRVSEKILSNIKRHPENYDIVPELMLSAFYLSPEERELICDRMKKHKLHEIFLEEEQERRYIEAVLSEYVKIPGFDTILESLIKEAAVWRQYYREAEIKARPDKGMFIQIFHAILSIEPCTPRNSVRSFLENQVDAFDINQSGGGHEIKEKILESLLAVYLSFRRKTFPNGFSTGDLWFDKALGSFIHASDPFIVKQNFFVISEYLQRKEVDLNNMLDILQLEDYDREKKELVDCLMARSEPACQGIFPQERGAPIVTARAYSDIIESALGMLKSRCATLPRIFLKREFSGFFLGIHRFSPVAAVEVDGSYAVSVDERFLTTCKNEQDRGSVNNLFCLLLANKGCQIILALLGRDPSLDSAVAAEYGGSLRVYNLFSNAEKHALRSLCKTLDDRRGEARFIPMLDLYEKALKGKYPALIAEIALFISRFSGFHGQEISEDLLMNYFQILNSFNSAYCKKHEENDPYVEDCLILKGDDKISHAIFSPRGNKVLTLCRDGTAMLYDTYSGKSLKTFSPFHDGFVSTCEFSPDGNQVLFSCEDSVARIMDINTGRVVRVLSGHTAPLCSAPLCSAAFSSDGSLIVTAGADSTVRIHSGINMQVIGAHKNLVRDAAFSKGGWLVVTASGAILNIWEVRSGKCIGVLEENTAGIDWARFYGKDKIIFYDSESVKIWDWKNKICTRILHLGEGAGRISLSPCETMIAACVGFNEGRIYDISKTRQIKTIKSHTARVNGIGFAPNCKRIVTCSDDHTARIHFIPGLASMSRSTVSGSYIPSIR